MKHLKDGALSYLFYLVGTFIFLIAVMTLDGSMTSPFSIRLSNILNYIDRGSLVFILAFCLLALACTKTMRPLKDAFVFMFQEQDYTVQQLSEYLLSIKVAAFAALTGGGMSFVVQIIKMLKSMDSDGGVSWAGFHISIAMISLAYSLVLLMILMPIYVALAQSLSRVKQREKTQKVPVSHKNRKAGSI